MSDYKFIKTEADGGLYIVTINRPDVMNACHPDTNLEMEQAFNEFQSNPDLWVAIVTGAGDRAFSAGNDLKFQASGGKMVRAKTGFGGLTARYDLNKPVIAAVNGVAMGGGFEIALACDIIVAAENAVFALPEPRVGLLAAAGGVHRLPRVIGTKRAMGMILTGRRVPAQEGYELGFVNEVVPEGQAVEAAKKWAAQILECSPMSIRASKEAVYKGLDEPSLEQAISTVYPGMEAMRNSDDFVEGPLAFSEKRKPNWKGK